MSNPTASPQPAARLWDHPAFLAVWVGQFASAVGAQLTAFSLSIWVFQGTGSVGHFGMVVAAQMLPAVLLASTAGVLADRFNRRRIMLFCKVAAVVVAAATFGLLEADILTPLTVGFATAVASSFATVHQIAYASSVPQLVPRELYQKANGLVQMSIHVSAVVVPLLAVVLLEWLGLGRIILIEGACAVVAVGTLLLARFGEPPARNATLDPEKKGLKKHFAQQTFGLRYVFGDPGLSTLMLYLAMASFINGFVYVLFRPLMLTLSDVGTLGTIVTIAGAGGLAGTIYVSFFARLRDRVTALLRFTLVSGVFMVLCGATQSIPLIALSAFGFSFTLPGAIVSVQVLLQERVPNEVRGRVFAARALLAGSSMLLAVLLSPALAELLFEPEMLDGGVLAGWFGQWFGQGPGRGIALLFVLAGASMVVVSLAAARSAALRGVAREQEAPVTSTPTADVEAS